MFFNSRFASWIYFSAVAIVVAAIPAHAFPSLGLSVNIVSEHVEPGSIQLVQNKHAAHIFLDETDYPGVLRAAADLQADIQRVTGVKP
jgi:hypothetical protein